MAAGKKKKARFPSLATELSTHRKRVSDSRKVKPNTDWNFFCALYNRVPRWFDICLKICGDGVFCFFFARGGQLSSTSARSDHTANDDSVSRTSFSPKEKTGTRSAPCRIASLMKPFLRFRVRSAVPGWALRLSAAPPTTIVIVEPGPGVVVTKRNFLVSN